MTNGDQFTAWVGCIVFVVGFVGVMFLVIFSFVEGMTVGRVVGFLACLLVIVVGLEIYAHGQWHHEFFRYFTKVWWHQRALRIY